MPLKREGIDVVMTRAQFEASKKSICKCLRHRGDPPPRVMRPGEERGAYFSNLRLALQKQGTDATVVRGYKMYHLPLSKKRFASDAWKGQFHMVVSVRRTNGDVYIDPNCAYHLPDQDREFVFVPSSSAHANLSDEQLLSGKFICGAVIGGEPTFAAMVCADQRLRGRHTSVIGISPTDCVARERVRIYKMPFFEEWFCQLSPAMSVDMEATAEFFGFPVCRIDEKFSTDSITQMADLIVHNREKRNAILDGRVTLQFYLDFKEAYDAGRYSNEEAKETWFEHYNGLRSDLDQYLDEKIHSKILNEL